MKRNDRQKLELADGLRQAVGHESDDHSSSCWSTWNVAKDLRKKNEEDKKSEGELEQSKSRHCWDRLEYAEESWRPKDSCCHSDSSKVHRVMLVGKPHKK